jgi:hypothetical protein
MTQTICSGQEKKRSVHGLVKSKLGNPTCNDRPLPNEK